MPTAPLPDAALLAGFSWPAASLAASFLFAGYILLGKETGLRSQELMLWRCFGPLVLTAPFLLIFELPTAPEFYLATVSAGLGIAFYDSRLLEGSRRYGSGPIARLQPLSVLGLFVVWVVFSEQVRTQLSNLGLGQATGLVVCLLIALAALSALRRSPLDRAAIRYVFPMLFAAVLIDSSNKTAMLYTPTPGGIAAYIFIHSLVAGLVYTFILERRALTHSLVSHLFSDRRVIVFGCVLAVVVILATTSKQIAMISTPNPSYVASLQLTAALWVTLYNRLRRRDDHSNIWAGLIFLAANIGIIFLAE